VPIKVPHSSLVQIQNYDTLDCCTGIVCALLRQFSLVTVLVRVIVTMITTAVFSSEEEWYRSHSQFDMGATSALPYKFHWQELPSVWRALDFGSELDGLLSELFRPLEIGHDICQCH
jgi:hypothetical protein